MDFDLVTTTIRSLLDTLGVEYETVTHAAQGGSTLFTVSSKDSAMLIGTNGETLQAINHLVKKILEPKMGREQHFTIDVNGYQSKKIKSLEDQARVVAERARTFRYDIEMSPMSSYERMIVHSALKGMPDIDTTSTGEGALRRIVVRYKDPNAPAAPAAPTEV